jgi:hypothetical protein
VEHHDPMTAGGSSPTRRFLAEIRLLFRAIGTRRAVLQRVEDSLRACCGVVERLEPEIRAAIAA